MGHKFLAILVLVLAAVAFSPLENRIRMERERLKYGGAHVTLPLREKLGQGTAVALLAGFRGVTADFLWIRNQFYFEREEWVPMYLNLEMVTTLQPLSTPFWDQGAWHIGWNIAYSARKDPKNANEAQGIRREREWHQKARDFLLRGIQNIPNDWDLYFCMAWLYDHKLASDCAGDAECQRAAHCKAAEYFRRAAEFSDAPPWVGRECARAMESCGQVREAYEYWKTLWPKAFKTKQQIPSMIEREIKRLEVKLAIPKAERLPRNRDGSLRVPP
ncbi:MAG: hypothetical protein ABSC38_05385 [Verrucomicrobiia bacterium]